MGNGHVGDWKPSVGDEAEASSIRSNLQNTNKKKLQSNSRARNAQILNAKLNQRICMIDFSV